MFEDRVSHAPSRNLPALAEAGNRPYLRARNYARSLSELFAAGSTKTKRQRPLRQCHQKPSAPSAAAKRRSSLRALRERTSRQPCSPLRRVLRDLPSLITTGAILWTPRSPERGANRLPRLERFLNSQFPLQDYVLSASILSGWTHAALSRPLLADAGHALSASRQSGSRILMNDFRFPLSSRKKTRRQLVEDCFRREAGSAASILPTMSISLRPAFSIPWPG